MGSRDYRRREAKKPKKNAKKPSPISTLQHQEAVEVIKKTRNPEEEESEE